MKIFRSIIILLICFVASTAMNAQNILTGVIKDKTGETVIGATVQIENKDHRSLLGTLSGLDGDFRLQVPNENNLTVVFSMIGYKTQRVKYTGQKTINIVFEEDSYTLDNIEVVAKRVERNSVGLTQREVVSSTQKVEMSMLETAPVSSIEDALQGRMANVDIITSAEPGSSSSIRIRGTSSLNASNDPLIVVDGVPYATSIGDDFEFATANTEDFGALLNIPPNDIESIEVLKDAAATAIWGSKGASGVLLINTKKGRSGKTSYSLDLKYEYGKERNSIPMLKSSQYVAMIQDAIWNSVGDYGTTSGKSLELFKLLYDTKEIGFDPTWIYFKEYNQETDWVDEIKQSKYAFETNFSMSGGGEKAIYRLSLGYRNEEGTTVGTGFERISASFNLTYKFSTKLDVTTDFSFVNSDKDDNWINPRGHAQNKMPNMSPYYIDKNGHRTKEYFTIPNFQGNPSVSDGKIGGSYNPVAMVHESKNNTVATDSRFNFMLHYKIIQGLDYRATVGLNLRKNKNKKFLPQSVTGLPWTDKWFNRSSDLITNNTYLYTENKLIYVGYIGEDHKITGTLAMQTNDTKSSSYQSEVSGNASSSTSDPTAGGSIAEMKSGESQARDLGFIGNVHYAYKDRYMVNGGYRYEASSAMGADNRWGGFPTVGLAWVPSEEAFLKSQNWMSFLKIRASWGKSGKAPSGSYNYIGTFTAITPGYIDLPAVQPNQMQLDKLKWETVTLKNIGLDLSLFNDKVMVTADIYKNETEDLLQKDYVIPSTTGFGKIKWFNSGKMTNEGWEFRFDVEAFKNKEWRVGVNFNIAQNKNKVNEMPSNVMDYVYEPKNGYYAYNVRIGDPLGSFYGYKYKGVYQNESETYARDNSGNLILDINGNPVYVTNIDERVYPGDAKYEDINGDGIINQYDIVYLGNSMPRITGGGGFDISYKDFMLSAFFHGRYGQKVINQTRISTENMYGTSNQSEAVLKRWRYEGDNTDIPRALYGKGYNYLGSDRFVEDASFLRLKTLTLRYNVPKSVIAKWGLSRLQVFCTGYDLLTWTDYTGQDPEVKLGKDGNYDSSIYMVSKDNSYTPKSMSFLFGISISY
ncbi:MAG: SusC/RagA family TonB-linked outer membrane protein [Dysgonomonas sp.]